MTLRDGAAAPVTGSTRLVRRLNESLILDALRLGPASRADLARRTGLTTGTVSNLVARMAARGLLSELGAGPSTGGRKPILVQLESRARVALGVHVSPESVEVVLADLLARPLARKTAPLPVSQDPEEVCERIRLLSGSVMADAGVAMDRVLGLGAAIPATVDVESGTVVVAPNLPGWRNLPFKALLERRLRVPVLVDNDANAAAHGELWCGMGSRYRDFVFVYADYGIGAGLVVNGHVYRGAGCAAGEIGHSVIDVNGPTCHCGRRGCLATVAAGKYLADRKAFGSVGELLAAARLGKREALQRLEQGGRYLGVALANLISVFSPEAIILGGRLALECEVYREAAVQAARREAYKPVPGHIDFPMSSLGDSACALGAATFILESFFRPYTVTRPLPVGRSEGSPATPVVARA